MKKALWALIIICSFGLSLSTAAHAQIPSCTVSVSVNATTIYLGQSITGTASVNENDDGAEVDTPVTVTSTQGDDAEANGHVNFTFTPGETGLFTVNASANVTPNPTDSATVMVVGIDKLQYSIPGQGDYADAPNPLVVPVGSTVDFQAVIAPADATWPAGKPVWGGTSDASGTGATTTVTFNTVSTSSTDYKTVTAECGNTATIDVIVCSLEMDRDGTKITSTQSVSVGQMMNLSAVVQPDGLTPTYQWTIPGSVVNDWQHTATIGGVTKSEVYPVSDDMLSSPNLSYAWLDGGNGRQVAVAVTVNGITIPSVTATFNVTRPTYELSITKGGDIRFVPDPNQSDPPGSWTLQDGNNNVTNQEGVIMDMGGVPLADQPNYEYEQIVTSYIDDVNAGVEWGHIINSGGLYTLDTSDPYILDPGLPVPETSDSPSGSVTPADSEIDISDSFSDYLMYRPPGAEHKDSIWVPLSTASWNWAAVAIKQGANWASTDFVSMLPLTPKTPVSAAGTSTTSYPGGTTGWTNNIQPFQWAAGE